MLYKVLEAHDMSLPDDCVVCFANTGKEDEATLKFVHDCETHWGIEINWLEYVPKGFKKVCYELAARNGEPFEALITAKKYLPNPVARFCTEELKVKTINRFLEFIGIEATTMVGVRADEPRRISKLRQRGLLVPLVDAGITQAHVQDFWNKQPFNLGLPFRDGITPLGNCDLCFLKGPEQILGLVKDNPDRAVWWANQERAIGATFRSDRPSYGKLHRFVTDQSDMFSNAGSVDCFCGD